jgi:glycosyltransferase involved in cell wall biosynthesis
MRILHIIPTLSGGGAERQLQYLSAELARLGHDIHIAYTEAGSEAVHGEGVTLHRLASRGNCDPVLFYRILTLIAEIEPDVVQTCILQMDVLGGVAALVKSLPWVLREANQAPAYPPTVKNWLRRLIGSGATAIVSNSCGGGEYWRFHKRRFTIRNAVPMHDIEQSVAALPVGFADLASPIVLYAARLEWYKHPEVFLHALGHVRGAAKSVGVVCGDGPKRQRLVTLSSALGIDRHVRLPGHLPRRVVWGLMKNASVFVSTSAFEGCPNSVIEAIACGCPLILTDIPAHRELVDESCAIFVRPGDALEVGEAILDTLRRPDSAQARAAVAKERSKAWSISNMARQYEIVYNQLLSPG